MPKPFARIVTLFVVFALLADMAAAAAAAPPLSSLSHIELISSQAFSAVAGPFTRPSISRRNTSAFWRRVRSRHALPDVAALQIPLDDFAAPGNDLEFDRRDDPTHPLGGSPSAVPDPLSVADDHQLPALEDLSDFERTLEDAYARAVRGSRFDEAGLSIEPREGRAFHYNPQQGKSKQVGRYNAYLNPLRGIYKTQAPRTPLPTDLRTLTGHARLFKIKIAGAVALVTTNQNAQLAGLNAMLIPNADAVLPQQLTEESIRVPLELLQCRANAHLKFLYNTYAPSGGWGSINHLHFQIFNGDPWPVESIALNKVAEVEGATLSRVRDWPAEFVVFQGKSPKNLARQVAGFVRFLESREITYMVLWTSRGVYVLPRPAHALKYSDRFNIPANMFLAAGQILLWDRAPFEGLDTKQIEDENQANSFSAEFVEKLMREFYDLTAPAPIVDPGQESKDPRDRHWPGMNRPGQTGEPDFFQNRIPGTVRSGRRHSMVISPAQLYRIVRLNRAFAEQHRSALVELVRMVDGSERTEEYVFSLPSAVWDFSVAAVDRQGQLVGILMAFPQNAQSMYGWRLCVAKEHRRNGLALLLLRRLLWNGYDYTFTLQTDASNLEGNSLYQAIGIPISQTLLVDDHEEHMYSAPVNQWIEGLNRLLSRDRGRPETPDPQVLVDSKNVHDVFVFDREDWGAFFNVMGCLGYFLSFNLLPWGVLAYALNGVELFAVVNVVMMVTACFEICWLIADIVYRRGPDLPIYGRAEQKAFRIVKEIHDYAKEDPLLLEALRHARHFKPVMEVIKVVGGGKDQKDRSILYRPWMAFIPMLMRYLYVRRSIGFYFDDVVGTHREESIISAAINMFIWRNFSNYELLKRARLYPLLVPYILIDTFHTSALIEVVLVLFLPLFWILDRINSDPASVSEVFHSFMNLYRPFTSALPRAA